MLVARNTEIRMLEDAYSADRSCFVAIYGRRRVGKTYLVREAFRYTFVFQHSGIANGTLAEQLFSFCASLQEAGLKHFEEPNNWLQAFELLKDLIRRSKEKKKVIFIDELSWMDTPRCDLMKALESFWNGWASARNDILLIVCASATSWMLDKVVHNKGGLYNRLTQQIELLPFTLHECEQLAQARGIALSRHQLLEYYMIMGGIPFYWDFLKKGLSLSQNIDAAIFARNAPLADEFNYLFASLYKHPSTYLAIVATLGKRKAGMTRKELAKHSGLSDSGNLTTKLQELESCGFIRRYRAFGKKNRETIYQLTDCFTLFHYKFLADRPTDEHFWTNQTNTPTRNAWCGVAFERVCLHHIPQIKAALGVSGVLTSVNSWSCERNDDLGLYGSQIDMLIARADHIVNVCEMKYSTTEYALTRKSEEALRHKISDFQLATRSNDAIHATLVTTYGLRNNQYASSIQSIVTANDLFQ